VILETFYGDPGAVKTVERDRLMVLQGEEVLARSAAPQSTPPDILRATTDIRRTVRFREKRKAVGQSTRNRI